MTGNRKGVDQWERRRALSAGLPENKTGWTAPAEMRDILTQTGRCRLAIGTLLPTRWNLPTEVSATLKAFTLPWPMKAFA